MIVLRIGLKVINGKKVIVIGGGIAGLSAGVKKNRLN